MPNHRELLELIWKAHLEYQNACLCKDAVRMDAAESALRKWIELIPSLLDYYERAINAPFAKP